MKNRGAITVFMVLITTVMLTFAGVMIDLSRILLARYAVISVSESATRSMMANYDSTLVGDYGLYAIEDTQANKDVFLDYVKRNISAEENSQSAEKTFSFLNFNNASLVEDETSVEFSNCISDLKVFEKQMKEYQTPRTVVLAVDEIVSKFINILTDAVAGQMLGKQEAASESVETVKDTAKALNEKTRKVKLVASKPKLMAKVDFGKMWTSVKKATKNQLASKSVNQVFSIGNDALFSKHSLEGVSGLDDAIYDVESQLKLLEESLGVSENELSNIKASEEENEYNSYNSDDVADYVDSGTDYNEVSDRITQIRTNISNAKTTITNAKEKFDEYAGDAVRCEVLFVAFKCYEEGWISSSSLTSLKSSLSSGINDDTVSGYLDDFSGYIGEGKNSDAETAIKDAVDEAYAGMNAQISAIQEIDIGSMMEIKEPEIKEDHKESEEEEANYEELDEGVTSIKNGLQRLTKDITKYEIYGKNSDNPVFNNLVTLIKDLSPLKSIKEIIKTANNIKDQGFGYQFVITSYIMDKTNYLTSSTQRDHYFKFGETEYILNHYSTEPFNVIKSAFDVFLIRLGVNFVYYFCCDSPPAAEGISYIIKATYSAVRSLITSVVNMVDMLVLGNDIKLIPAAGKWGELLSVSYRDHLTVAVLFETEKQERLINTMNATIASKAELDGKTTSMTNLYTTAKTNLTVDCDLVFLNMFGFRDILGDVVEGKYRITQTTVFNY